MRIGTMVLIWISASVFAVFGFYGLFWNGKDDPLVGCCLILVSLVLVVLNLFLVYREMKKEELRTHREKLFSLLETNGQKIEDYRSKYSECVKAIRNEFNKTPEYNIDTIVALIDRACAGDKQILEKLLEEREEIVRALVREETSDSDSC